MNDRQLIALRALEEEVLAARRAEMALGQRLADLHEQVLAILTAELAGPLVR